MTLKERIWGAFWGTPIDRVSFTTYPGLFPEREELVKAGLVGTMNRCSVYRESSSGEIEVTSEEYQEGNESCPRVAPITSESMLIESICHSSLRMRYVERKAKSIRKSWGY